MPSENLNIGEINEARRQSLAKTIHAISIEDLKSIEEQLFPYADDPWRDRFVEFVKENSGATFYHATTSDGFHVIYCHSKEKGIWYVPGTGLGPLQEKGLKAMKKIVEKS